jgi:hypothetical protein
MTTDTTITGNALPGARKLAFTTYDAVTVLLAVIFVGIALTPMWLMVFAL